MTWFEIRPQDVWLFRDGKPFSAGEDHAAHSMFPPTPLTVQGALRRQISESQGVSLYQYRHGSTQTAREVVAQIGPYGDLLDTGQFKMQGPFVGLHTREQLVPLFPSPADLLWHEGSGDFRITGPNLDAALSSDLSAREIETFCHVYEGYENLPAHWITTEAFTDYLAGRKQTGKGILHKDHVYQSENRFGVAINAASSYREEGLLYQVQFVRPQPGISLLVAVDGELEKHLKGEIQLGGEQRRARLYPATVQLPPRPAQLSGHFKIIFLTPAYFSGGWEPQNGDWSSVFNSHPVEFITAALYRPQRIGGWNSYANRPRAMHNYVAPGSVYYFKTEQAFAAPPALTQNPVEIVDAAALGFGQYAVSTW